MAQQLSLATRPKYLDDLVGQQKMVAQIRGHATSGRIVKAWLLTGATGTGKTTTARIIALSLQCEHQKIFGRPCKACRAARTSFDIYDINCAKLSTKEALEIELRGAWSAPMNGAYRVYILDEFHKASDGAQSMSLGYLENAPDSTIFIICSTAPRKLLDTIQSRCVHYKLKELSVDDVLVLVTRLLAKVESELPADRLADALVEEGVTYPRLICQAVEKYLAGASPEDAATVRASEALNTRALGSALLKGDWVGVTKYLNGVQVSDIREIRLSMIAYLRAILLGEPEISERAAAVQKSLTALCNLQNAEDITISGGVAAALYTCCAFFERYKH